MQYSREELISLFRPQTLEQLSNSKHIISLLKITSSILNDSLQFPLNFYSDQLSLKSISQDLILHTSNSPTPMKTVSVKSQDQFRFDEEKPTPRPQQNDAFSIYLPANFLSPQKQARGKPVFSYSRQMRYESLQSRVWFYIDDSNNVQGPFSSIEMDSWYAKGFFSHRTEISYRQKKADSFLKLKYLKQNKYILGESIIYSQIIGRRKSAPSKLSTTEQIQQRTPNTIGKAKFAFTESELQNQRVDKEDNSEYYSLFQKVLSIPTIKLKKNKKIREQ